MSTSSTHRVSAGRPESGQFADRFRDDGDVYLDAPVTIPKFTADQFDPSGYDSGTPVKKAAFANAFVRFVDSGFDRAKFSKSVYTTVSNTMNMGFIAEYDADGFYGYHFSDARSRALFLEDFHRGVQDHHSNRADIWDDVKAGFAESPWLADRVNARG